MADRAHKEAMDVLDGQGESVFPQSFQTTLQYDSWKSFLIAEINYYWGMSEGIFAHMFLDEFDRLPRPPENEVRLKCAELHKNDITEGVTKRATIKHERSKK